MAANNVGRLLRRDILARKDNILSLEYSLSRGPHFLVSRKCSHDITAPAELEERGLRPLQGCMSIRTSASTLWG